MSRMAGASTKDLAQRLARSSLRQEESTLSSDAYGGVSSPVSSEVMMELEGDAASGAAIEVSAWDRRWLGLVTHNAAIGVVSTALPLAVYPFMTCNLNMEGTQTLSVRILLALPWVLKPFFMVVLDNLPLPSRVCRRRTSLVLGWAITAAALIYIFSIDQPAPFFGDRALVGSPLRDLTADQLATINHNAPGNGALYAMLMAVAVVGYVLADVAADALAREISSRCLCPPDCSSSEASDELLDPMLTKWRTFAMLVTFPFMGVAMSGWDYGGDFDFTLQFTDVMLIVGIVAALPIPFAWCAIDEAPAGKQWVIKSARSIWSSLCNCAVSNVLMLRFVSGIFNGFSSVGVNPVAFYFAGVQPLNDNVVSFVAITVVLLSISHITKKGWNVDYRLLTIAATMVVLVLDCGATMFTIWDVVRSQWVWIGLPVMEAIPSVLDYVIFTNLMSELADPGTELLMGALVTAISFVANALGLALSKYIDAQFDVSNQDIMEDSTSARFQLTGVFLIAYAAQAISMACVVTLPRHASEAREWKARSGSSTARAVALVAVVALSLAAATAVHVLSVNQSTSCLGLAAGTAC
jgi:hypothetical protein